MNKSEKKKWEHCAFIEICC